MLEKTVVREFDSIDLSDEVVRQFPGLFDIKDDTPSDTGDDGVPEDAPDVSGTVLAWRTHEHIKPSREGGFSVFGLSAKRHVGQKQAPSGPADSLFFAARQAVYQTTSVSP